MGKVTLYVLALVVAAISSGCASGHCRGRAIAEDKKVFVFKPDGSLQCDKKPGRSVEQMASELNGIAIFSQIKKSDGKMHVTMCGAASGQINVYEINQYDLEKAKSLHFEELK